MKYNVIGYLIGEGLRSIFKNKKASIASLGTMCATMFIFGIFFAISQNINNFVTNVEDEQAIRVNIEKAATAEQIEKLGEQIKAIDGVREIEYRSEDDALEIMKKQFGDKASLLDMYVERNIFSAAYIVRLTDLGMNVKVQDEINKLENVKSITHDDQTIETLLKVAKAIRIVMIVLLALLILISVFIISNTIKLTVHARRKEISIMKYVGATNRFIKFPFIVEGIVIGIIAGAISILLVGGVYNIIASNLANSPTLKLIGMQIVSFANMFNLIVVVYLILGIGIGVTGSSISMKKYLNV